MKRYERIILSALLAQDLSIWKIMKWFDLNKDKATKIMNGLYSKGYIGYGNKKMHITKKGRGYAKRNGLTKKVDFGITDKNPVANNNRRFKQLVKKLNKFSKQKPKLSDKFWQGSMTDEDVVARAVFAYERGDVEGCDILILGDDDFLCFPLAMLNAKRVVVVEIDKKLVAAINKLARKHKLPIKAYIFNAENALPKKFKRVFDTFFSDPVETLAGLRLFLSRGVDGLKGKDAAMYFGLTTRESSLNKWAAVHKMLRDMNFVVTDILRHTATYIEPDREDPEFYEAIRKRRKLKFPLPIAEIEWYSSSLVRAVALKKPKALVTKKRKLGKAMYVDEEIDLLGYL